MSVPTKSNFKTNMIPVVNQLAHRHHENREPRNLQIVPHNKIMSIDFKDIFRHELCIHKKFLSGKYYILFSVGALFLLRSLRFFFLSNIH